MLLTACVLTWIAYARGEVISLGETVGIGLPAPREWISSPLCSLLVSIGCTTMVGFLLLSINRTFNVMRSITSMMAGLFFVMQVALPSVMGRFYGGDISGVLITLCIALLFSSYADSGSQRNIYLIFMLITLAGVTDLSYLLYLPVFLLGCVQMRIFDLRTLLAAILGVITPPWILLGFGLISPTALHWPDLTLNINAFPTQETIQAAITAGFTLILGVSFTIANLLKILSYNSRIRAFNGFLTLLLIATGIFAILNFANFTFYIPLLNCLTAYQIAHFFSYRRFRRSYIPILLIVIVYLAFYCWALYW
jgi:hypothetical protein